MATRFKRQTIALAPLLAGVLLGTMPAHAMLVKATGSPEQDKVREAAAHAAGAKHKCMVKVTASSQDDNEHWVGSGVYIGLSEDQQTGYILTAAHPFQFDPLHLDSVPFRITRVMPGPVANWFQPLLIKKIYIHPDYLPPGKRNDLAVLTFSVPENYALLDKLLAGESFLPAQLAEGNEGREGHSQVAEIVGFGDYGTRPGKPAESTGRVHAGFSLVYFSTDDGGPVFINYTPSDATDDSDPEAIRQRATAMDHPISALALWEPNAVHWIQTHPEQVIPSHGDSGGGLFIGEKLVGLTVGMGSARLIPTPGDRAQGWFASKWNFMVDVFSKRIDCVSSIFEPIANYLEWIDDIEQGHPAAWVIEVGKGSWKKVGDPGPSPAIADPSSRQGTSCVIQ